LQYQKMSKIFWLYLWGLQFMSFHIKHDSY
jgi:hypothetical protein